MNDAVRDDFALGIAGFSFADLYEPRRLRDLHEAFWKFAVDSWEAARFSPFIAVVLSSRGDI